MNKVNYPTFSENEDYKYNQNYINTNNNNINNNTQNKNKIYDINEIDSYEEKNINNCRIFSTKKNDIFEFANPFKNNFYDRKINEFIRIEPPKEKEIGEFTEIKSPEVIDKSVNKNNKTDIFDISNINIENYEKENRKINSLNLVKSMSVLKSQNENSWMNNFKSLVSSLYYNYKFIEKLDIQNIYNNLYIFDEIINPGEISFYKKTFLYMSYRSGFNNLSSVGCGDFSSDCGWGCMLRCCQMMLSKGIIQKKIYDSTKNMKNKITDNILTFIRKSTLYLFNDNYLPIEQVREIKEYSYFWKLFEEIAKKNNEYSYIKEVIPPYSIHILSKLGKCAGEYTSDIKIVKIFADINSLIFNNDFNIFVCESGYISHKKIIDIFGKPVDFINDHNSEKFFETETYNGVEYTFKKGGIIFISFRLGLYEIDPSYYEAVLTIFKKMRNNIGFVCGKKNRAYYFIGCDENNKLIFADPHLNQQTTHNIEVDYKTYLVEDLFLLDVKELSSELTLGVTIFCEKDFSNFFDDIRFFEKEFPGFITLK